MSPSRQGNSGTRPTVRTDATQPLGKAKRWALAVNNSGRSSFVIQSLTVDLAPFSDEPANLLNFPWPCSPTLKQVDRLRSTEPMFYPVPSNLKTPLFQFHPVPPNMETPLSLFLLFRVNVLQLVPTSSIWGYHLSFPNSLFSDFFWVPHCHSIFRKKNFD